MDPGLLPGIIVALQNVVTTRYVSAAGFVLLIYDHLLTLGDEVEYIWSAPFTLAKSVFLILRYMVPLFLLGETITRSGLAVIPMSDTVRVKPLLRTYAGWFSITISNFLVLLRIWATLPRGHRYITWSLAFFIFVQVASFGVTSWGVSNMIAVLFFDPAAGFCSFSSKPNVVGLWLPGILFEVVVFVTAWWNALDRPRTVGPDSNSHISRVFFRDGVAYFVILFVLRVANAVLAIVAPVSLMFVGVYFIWASTTLTTSRLIINARREVGLAERRRELQMPEPQTFEDTSDIDETRRLRSMSSARLSKGVSFWV
ncbi:hypothetical protein B0H13DRAFT_447408 [Mycena leptocephala]|nr:hypothetical protein B0H13DRAFT_447408 [Mycena leptocephala]